MTRFILLPYFLSYVFCGPNIKIPLGNLTGVYHKVLGVELESFLGIPYAKAPIDEGRFSLPEPYGRLENFEATRYSPQCPQFSVLEDESSGIPQDEDCLFLNIHRRRGTRKEDFKAVIVTFHGGGFVQGSSADMHQNAAALAAVGDVILVNFNYRLGVLGFANFGRYAPGNLGFYDQRMVLQWVQDHIADFGGNPEEVTVMGSNAGSVSIAAHIITMIDDKKLFKSAVMDAGVLTSRGLFEDASRSNMRIKKIANDIGCPDNAFEMVDCLRDASVQDLIKASEKYRADNSITTFVPTSDGYFVPHFIEDFIEEKYLLFRKVRTMIGYALDEGTLFVGSGTMDFDWSTSKTKEEVVEYCMELSRNYNFDLNLHSESTKHLIRKLYVDESPRNPFSAISAFQGDGIFKCPMNSFIKNWAHANKDIYVYQFERRFNLTYFPMYDSDIFGVFDSSPYLHFTGSMFLYGELDEINPEDKKFSVETMELIARFAKTDEAPEFRGVKWPKFPETGKVFIFNETANVRDGLPSDGKCAQLFNAPREEESSFQIKTEL